MRPSGHCDILVRQIAERTLTLRVRVGAGLLCISNIYGSAMDKKTKGRMQWGDPVPK